MDIQIKRIYENAEPSDGKRILVDRLWSRELVRKMLIGISYGIAHQRSNKRGRGSPSEDYIQCDGYNLAHTSF